jgi:hypothetical protein
MKLWSSSHDFPSIRVFWANCTPPTHSYYPPPTGRLGLPTCINVHIHSDMQWGNAIGEHDKIYRERFVKAKTLLQKPFDEWSNSSNPLPLLFVDRMKGKRAGLFGRSYLEDMGRELRRQQAVERFVSLQRSLLEYFLSFHLVQWSPRNTSLSNWQVTSQEELTRPQINPQPNLQSGETDEPNNNFVK